MNEQNLAYLKTSLKYLGFGEKLNSVLESAIKQELPNFKLVLNNTVVPPGVERDHHEKHDHISYEVNFNKAKENDTYFLNSFKATLNKAGLPAREHTFNVSQQGSFTVREAYNLLSGRAVNKDLKKENSDEKVNVWTKLDLEIKDARGNFPGRYFHPNYGYDLEKSLSKYPIGDLNDTKKKADLLAGLKKGDLMPAVISVQNKNSSVYVAAKPDMKGVYLFDAKMHAIRDHHIWPEKAKDANLEKSSSVTQVESKEQASVPKISAETENGEKKSRKIGR